MKAILMSIRPQHVANILNGLKTIEIRKKFPKDYVGWVYIYCTKGNKEERLIADLQPDKVYHPLTEALHRGSYSIVDEDLIWNDCKKNILNGKVVGRFWCDKVGAIEYEGFGGFAINMPSHIYNSFVDKFYSLGDLLRASCLSYDKFHNYLKGKNGYAIHITKLDPFDKPKEIKEFSKKEFDSFITGQIEHYRYPLTRAPQSFCFIEV